MRASDAVPSAGAGGETWFEACIELERLLQAPLPASPTNTKVLSGLPESDEGNSLRRAFEQLQKCITVAQTLHPDRLPLQDDPRPHSILENRLGRIDPDTMDPDLLRVLRTQDVPLRSALAWIENTPSLRGETAVHRPADVIGPGPCGLDGWAARLLVERLLGLDREEAKSRKKLRALLVLSVGRPNDWRASDELVQLGVPASLAVSILRNGKGRVIADWCRVPFPCMDEAARESVQVGLDWALGHFVPETVANLDFCWSVRPAEGDGTTLLDLLLERRDREGFSRDVPTADVLRDLHCDNQLKVALYLLRSSFQGGSAGALLGFAWVKALADLRAAKPMKGHEEFIAKVREIEISRVTMSATLDCDGKLGEVRGIGPKFNAADGLFKASEDLVEGDGGVGVVAKNQPNIAPGKRGNLLIRKHVDLRGAILDVWGIQEEERKNIERRRLRRGRRAVATLVVAAPLLLAAVHAGSAAQVPQARGFLSDACTRIKERFPVVPLPIDLGPIKDLLGKLATTAPEVTPEAWRAAFLQCLKPTNDAKRDLDCVNRAVKTAPRTCSANTGWPPFPVVGSGLMDAKETMLKFCIPLPKNPTGR